MENEIKSIWDGWTEQFRYLPEGGIYTSDGEKYRSMGHHCAVTYMHHRNHRLDVIAETGQRVAAYILARHPEADSRYYMNTLIYANNVLGWTPEQFRQADRESQIESAVKPLLESVSEVGKGMETTA